MLSKHSLYDFKEKIGHGSFGEVWLVKNRNTGKKCVLKKLKLSSCSHVEKQRAVLEAQLLATLRHPNIVTYHDSFFQPHESNRGQKKETILNIVMCFCEGGDLYEYIQKRKNMHIEEEQIVEWLIQLCMALKYLNDKRILHRDLKTRNIFLTRKGLIKLGDFGIARVLDGTLDMAATQIGTPYYMSPEILAGKPYNHKSDIWSLGCCVYEMASLKHAFRARSFNSLLFKVLHCKPPEIPCKYSQELLVLTSTMLSTDPDQRPSAKSILEYPFIHKHIFRFLENTKNRSPAVCDKAETNSMLECCPENVNKNAVTETGIKTDYINPEIKSQLFPTNDTPVKSDCKISSSDAIYKGLVYEGRTFNVNELCDKSKKDKSQLERKCSKVPFTADEPSAEIRTVLVQSPQHELNNKCNEICISAKAGENQALEPKVSPPSEARVRRRQLRKCSCSSDFLNNFNTKENDENASDFQAQKQNASARQRRRERLNQEVFVSKEGNGKSRPKSAPSRFSKVT